MMKPKRVAKRVNRQLTPDEQLRLDRARLDTEMEREAFQGLHPWLLTWAALRRMSKRVADSNARHNPA